MAQRVSFDQFKLTHSLKGLVTLCDLVPRQFSQPFETECFDRETGEHTPIDHGLTEVGEADFFYRAGEISGDSACKRVPRPSRIMNVFERVCAAAEKVIFSKK